jgi:hypothetical protein
MRTNIVIDDKLMQGDLNAMRSDGDPTTAIAKL